MKALLLPVIAPCKSRFRNMTWLDKENGGAYFPSGLLSFEFKNKNEYMDQVRDHVGLYGVKNPDIVLFGDSGGFGMARRRLKIDPYDVIKWQINYCTRGAVLDRPPYYYSEGEGGTSLGSLSTRRITQSAAMRWEQGINDTAETVSRARKLYEKAREEGKRFRWWGVCQGQTPEQMQDWWSRLSAVYPFMDEGEGWCFAPKGKMRNIIMVQQLRFAVTKGIRRLHFLGFTGWRSIGLLCGVIELLCPDEIDEVTFDSASASIAGSHFGAFATHSDYSYKKTFICAPGETRGKVYRYDRKGSAWSRETLGDYDVPERARFQWECRCQACQWWVEDSGYSYEEMNKIGREVGDMRSQLGYYVILHNVLTMRDACERIYVAAREDPQAVIAECAGYTYKGTSERPATTPYGEILRIWHDDPAKSITRTARGTPITLMEVLDARSSK